MKHESLAILKRGRKEVHLLDYLTDASQIRVKLFVAHRTAKRYVTVPVEFKETIGGYEPFVAVDGRHYLISDFKDVEYIKSEGMK